MIFNGVSLPDTLRIALEEGRLVVFAGAGISMPEPSKLPSFNDLVRKIASLDEKIEITNPERILGKLCREKKDVHTAAAQLVYHSGTKPTDLHRELLRLFGDPKKVRIVTTNFDNHFTDAAQEIFSATSVTEYHAPALPLGDDFEGIVYLHGTARLDPRKLVLTDEDFGKAYLTRGWARDFLMALFARYIVLFVGYSHNDVTVSYLARGMNPAEIKPRWAYVPADIKQDAQENWSHLGVETARYPVDHSSSGNTHQALTDFTRSWANHQHESLLDRSVKVRAIAANLPPEGDAEAEYILYCLKHGRLAQDFCNAITHPAWFGWMEGKKLFGSFFAYNAGTRSQDFSTTERIIAGWVCAYIRSQHPYLLLELIQRNNNELSRPFADLLGWYLARNERGKPADAYFHIWVAVLLAQGSNILRQDTWAYLLQVCEIPQHTAVALRIFEILTTPIFRVEKSWILEEPEESEDKTSEQMPKKKPEFEIHWPTESDHWLEEAWTKVFRPKLGAISEMLVDVVTKQLSMAHHLLASVEKATSDYDSLSWSISSIAPHEQNRETLHKCLSMLVLIARELLDFWMAHNRARALAQLDVWWASNIPLLQRLVIYGVATDSGRKPDEKLAWLLSIDLVFAYGKKKEVFDLLAAAYPAASATSRRKIVTRVKAGIQGDLAEKLDPETKAYETFNTLQWLKKSDPKCRIVDRALRALSKAHPRFTVRDYLEFDHWHGDGGLVDSKEEFDYDKVLAEPPDSYLDKILSAKEASFRHDQWTYLSNLKVLFEKDRDWGHRFMVAAGRREEADTTVWNSVSSAWRELLKTQQDWCWILDKIEELPARPAIYANVAYLLSHGFWSDDIKATTHMIKRALHANMKAWALCKEDPEMPDGTHQGWLDAAINHPGGWIAKFWIGYCSNQRKYPKKLTQGIPRKIRAAMIEALGGKYKVQVYARVALTPFVAYLFVWDKVLVREKFLPLFDWKRDPVIAQQSWSVFLNYRRATDLDWEKQLLPYYRQFVKELPAMFKQTTEQKDQFDSHTFGALGWHLASLAMRAVENPVESGFFREFLPLLPDKVRGSLARGMGDFIKKMNPKDQALLWQTWLRDYLDKRILGIPASLSHEETREIAKWCLNIGDLFPDAVALISKMPLKTIFVHSIIEELLASPLLEKFPEAACEYIVVSLRADEFHHLHGDLPKLHARLKTLIPSSPQLRTLEIMMYELGWKPDAGSAPQT